MIWNTDSSRAASRPATAITTIRVSQPAIQPAARAVEVSARDSIRLSIPGVRVPDRLSSGDRPQAQVQTWARPPRKTADERRP